MSHLEPEDAASVVERDVHLQVEQRHPS